MSIPLRPVDAVHVTTLIDNSADVLLPDEGLVRRWGLNGTAGPLPVVPSGVAREGRTVDFLRAEHGFSALVELHVDGRARKVLFDAGVSPDGLIGNIVRHAKQLTGIDQVYAVLGGFHLRFGPVVDRSVTALAEEAPTVVVPAHCTSWKAQHALAARLPDAFRPNAVGSRFEL